MQGCLWEEEKEEENLLLNLAYALVAQYAKSIGKTGGSLMQVCYNRPVNRITEVANRDTTL